MSTIHEEIKESLEIQSMIQKNVDLKDAEKQISIDIVPSNNSNISNDQPHTETKKNIDTQSLVLISMVSLIDPIALVFVLIWSDLYLAIFIVLVIKHSLSVVCYQDPKDLEGMKGSCVGNGVAALKILPWLIHVIIGSIGFDKDNTTLIVISYFTTFFLFYFDLLVVTTYIEYYALVTLIISVIILLGGSITAIIINFDQFLETSFNVAAFIVLCIHIILATVICLVCIANYNKKKVFKRDIIYYLCICWVLELHPNIANNRNTASTSGKTESKKITIPSPPETSPIIENNLDLKGAEKQISVDIVPSNNSNNHKRQPHTETKKNIDTQSPFPSHLTLAECAKLHIHDKIDHRDQTGCFIVATIREKKGSNLKISYSGYSSKWDVWSDYQKDLHRFAKCYSISRRPPHRFKNLKKGDCININPIQRHPGWKHGKIRRFVHETSGQVQIVYEFTNKNYLYWTHLDNKEEITDFN